MAQMLLNPKIGDVAYPRAQPQRAGIVIAMTEVDGGIRVLMPNGGAYNCAHPNDFLALIADHEKKLATHKALLQKIVAMKTGAS